MRRQICSSYKCRNKLLIFDEVMMGLCEAHINLLLRDDFYTGVCWQCQSITIVSPNRKGLIKDKYIFSKACKNCTGNEESNIDWMTIKQGTPPSMEIPREGLIKYLEIKTLISKDGEPHGK